MENATITLVAGTSRDLRTNVSGTCSLPGTTVTICSWLKSVGRSRECFASCTAASDGTWSLRDFDLLRPENFVEADRLCCVQASMLTSEGVVTSSVAEVEADIPYAVRGTVLEAGSYNALACAVGVAPQRTPACSVQLTADFTVTKPIPGFVGCLLDGDGHTITCLSHTYYLPLFDSVKAGAELRSLKAVYPAWVAAASGDPPADGFAGLVRENGGTIDGCHVQLDLIQEQTACAGVACLCTAGSAIRNCTVTGRLTGRSAAGIVHTLRGGSVEGCTVNADLHFKEFGGGIVVSAEEGSSVTGCAYEGKLTAVDPAYVASRLCGGVAARCEGASVSDCRAEVSFDLVRSGMGGYAGGIAGQCVSTSIVRCGVGAKVACHWVYGGIAGKMRNGSAVKECAVFGRGTMTESRMVAGGLTGDLGAGCTLGDSYECQDLRTFVYGGGLAGYNPAKDEGARIERCYSASSLHVRSGGGIRMTGGAAVEGCVGVWPVLCAAQRMDRIGEGSGVASCVAYDGTLTDGGVPIASSGERLAAASEFGLESTFAALGWDFANVWQMSPEGNFPRLRNLASPQTYPYPFLMITYPATAPYVFGANDTVRFEGYACGRTAEVRNRIEPVGDDCFGTILSAPVVGGKWSFAVGTLAKGRYKLTQTYSLDGRSCTQTAEFSVS